MHVALHLVLMIVPIACLVLALRFTRALPSDDPLVLRDDRGAKRRPRLWLDLAGAALFGTGMLVAWALPSPANAIVIFGFSMPAVALMVRAHAVRRMAARGLLMSTFAPLLFFHVLWSSMFLEATGLSGVAALWTGCLACVLLLWLQLGRYPRLSRWNHAFALLFFTLLLVMGIGPAWRTTQYAMPDRLDRRFTNYVEGFDASPRHMSRWNEMSRVAAYLTSQGNPADLSIPRQAVKDALQTPKKIWPYSWRGAIVAGALGPQEYAELLATQEHRSRKARVHPTSGRYAISDDTWSELVVFIEAGTLTQLERDAIAFGLARSWPRKHGYGRLADAHRICDLLTRLGRDDLIEAERPALLDLLKRSWCDTAPSYGTPGGFSPYDRSTDVGPFSKPHTPTPEANLDALDLMEWVGVPPGIDPARMATHAWSELQRSGERSFGVLNRGRLLHALTLQRVRRTYDTSPSLPTMLDQAAFLLALLLPLMFVVIVICRAPSVEVIDKQAPGKRAGLSADDKRPARQPAV